MRKASLDELLPFKYAANFGIPHGFMAAAWI